MLTSKWIKSSSVLRVKPPLAIAVRLAVPQEIVRPDKEPVQERRDLDHPPNQVVRPPGRLVPGADLDAATADMLSVGWVVIRDGRVDLSSARTHIVRPSGDVGSSASVHGLTDTMVGLGHDWTTVLSKIIEVLTGRVLLVHHAGLDKALLDRMCKKKFGARLLVPVVDTLALEHKRQQQRHHIDAKKSLRLAELRTNYNLPRYDAHDCLVDAIATAELLIAMVAHYGGDEKTSLGTLLT